MSEVAAPDAPPPTGSPTEQSDSVAAFAAALRALKREGGDPTLAKLSAHTGISKSVLSTAFSGRGLPTERTVAELVRELGGDQAEWLARRDALDPRKQIAPAEEPQDAQPGRRFTLLQMGVTTGIAIVATALVTSLLWGWLGPSSVTAGTPENAEGPYLEAANGVDPMRTACKEDSVIAADEARFDGQVHVQLLYSNNCLAVWGRVTRYDGKSGGNEISMKIWPAKDPQSKRSQERSAQDLQSIYTPLIIEPDPEARICGIATITSDGETVELGPPLCV